MEQPIEIFEDRLLLTVPQVARALSLAPRTVYNSISRGDFPIPVKKVGRSVRFNVKDLLNYVDSL